MEPLMIRRVRLRDFLSHADTEVEFSKGVNVLIGPNGAGKTGILEAIYFALTRRGWRTSGQRRVTALIREGRSSAEVTLEFEMGGRRYVVRRFIGGNRQDIIAEDGKPVAQGAAPVTEYIGHLLGLTIDQLDKIVLIPQGGITRLFTQLRAAQRKEAVDKLLGLHIYQEVGNTIKEVPITAEVAGVPRTFYPRRPSNLVKEARRIRESLEIRQEQVRKALEEVRRELGEVRARLATLRERLRELEKAARRYEEIDEELRRARAERGAMEARLRDAEAEARRLREELARAEAEIGALTKEAEELETRARAATLKPLVEELGKLIERESLLAERARAVREHLRGLEEKMRRIRELEAEVPGPLDELRDRLGALLAEKERLSDRRIYLLSTIARIRERAGTLKEVINSSEAQLREAAEAASRASGTGVGVEEVEEVIESLLKEIGEELGRVEKEITELSMRAGALRSGIEENKRKLNLIKHSDSPKCPLCGRPLTPEHRERIVRELEEETRSMSEELAAIEARLAELERLREELKEKAAVITPDLLRTVKELRRQAAAAEEELGRLRGEEAGASRELEALEERLRRMSEEEERLRGAVRKAEILEELRQGFSSEEYERIREEAREVEERVREAGDRIASLAREIAREAELRVTEPRPVYEAAAALVEGAEEAGRRLAEVRARLDEVRSRAEQLRAEAIAREELAEELRQGIASLAERVKALEEELAAAKAAKEELERLRGEEAALSERLASLEEKERSLLQEAEELRRSVEELRRAFRVAYVASWLAENMYSRDGLPKKMRPKILRLLEAHVEKLVDSFNLGFQDVRIDEDYEVTLAPIDNPRVRRPIAALSGGEQVSVSMAVLLAMFYAVSGSRIGFMALDEPTEYLDEERQRALVELFRKFQGGKILPQLIVVTHDESIKEVADRLYLVEKVNGVSRVTQVEPGEWG